MIKSCINLCVYRILTHTLFLNFLSVFTIFCDNENPQYIVIQFNNEYTLY